MDYINIDVPKILSGLYLGNIRDAKDADQLAANNITQILSIHDNAKKIVKDKEYLCILASDSPYQNLIQYFPMCNDFITQARQAGGGVLIHCVAGVSRSATLAAAYLMASGGLSTKDALTLVKAARSVIRPNIGFRDQLLQFEYYSLNG
ncbi:DUSP22, partial [Cordylochernes scorpioides]